jgi:hypothetical protein
MNEIKEFINQFQASLIMTSPKPGTGRTLLVKKHDQCVFDYTHRLKNPSTTYTRFPSLSDFHDLTIDLQKNKHQLNSELVQRNNWFM